MKLSENFSLHEFVRSETAARLGIDNTPPQEVIDNLAMLAQEMLQPLRQSLRASIHITSGYRCPELNGRVNGSTRSQHLHGLAADFVVTGMRPLQVCQAIVDLKLPFDQVIHEFGEWTHVSVAAVGANPRGQVLTIDRRGTRAGLHEVRK